MQVQTEIVVNGDELKSVSLEMLNSKNSPHQKEKILANLSLPEKLQRTYNMLQVEKKNRRKDKAAIKEFEALKREHLKTLDIRLADIKDE